MILSSILNLSSFSSEPSDEFSSKTCCQSAIFKGGRSNLNVIIGIVNQQLIMWSISKTSTLLLLLTLSAASYLQFSLLRLPTSSQTFKLEPVNCKNESSINQDAEYKEVCYEKDISYIIPFMKDGQHFGLSADLTTPISWIKGPECKIEGTNEKCKRLMETLKDKAKDVKKKIVKKFHKDEKKEDAEVENAIIEGSSEVIRGEFEKSKNIQFVSKDSSRLNNFFELIMLGLFIYGERDHLSLEQTNFINAISITPNLNSLSDGAISMRFDQTSENSFLNEIFTYVKSTDKTVTIYLGTNKTLTIGDTTAKYSQSGFSSITWINMPDDQGFGKLLQISDISIEDRADDKKEDDDETLPAVVTLSASYIGLPEFVINGILKTSFGKSANCKIDSKSSFLTCEGSNKKNIEKLLQKDLIFGFGESNIMIKLEDLILKKESKKVIFNIKKTFNNHAILGEPIFKKYFVLLDYNKNRIGFAPKRETFGSTFINVVSLVRFLCFIFVLGCSFILCYQPLRKMVKAFKDRNMFKGEGSEKRRLKQYSPIQDNPYEDLKGKIQEVISSTQKEVQGI